MRHRRAPLLFAAAALFVCAAAVRAAPVHTPYGTKPLAEVEALAQGGDAMAQAELGLDYENAVGFPRDMAQSFTWLSKSAAAGNPYGEGYLATFYYDGDRGVPKDERRAHALVKKAADQGVAEFEFVCGYDYMWGIGVDQDPRRALPWWRKAADGGDARAQARLGEVYMDGDGVPKDMHQARLLFEKSAPQGNPEGQYGLSQIYYFGYDHVPVDYAQALKWATLSAQQSYMPAAHMVAALYSRGEGAPQNWDEAFKWEFAAAYSGDPTSQKDLAFFYRNGRGTPANKPLALVWASIAADQGDAEAASLAQSLPATMTPDEMTTATKTRQLIAGTLAMVSQHPQ